jgi:hypothetical protein
VNSIYRLGANKKDLSGGDKSLMVEHLEKSSPLIIEEVRRWRDLIWDEYLDYKYHKKLIRGI